MRSNCHRSFYRVMLCVIFGIVFGATALAAQNQPGGGLGPAILGGTPLTGGGPQTAKPQGGGSALGQASAGNGPPAGQNAGNRGMDPQIVQLRGLMDTLAMPEDQRDQVRKLIQNLRQQLMSVRQDSSLAPSDKQEKLKGIRQETAKQFVALLTPDQKKHLVQIRQQERAATSAPGATGAQQSSDPAAELVSGFDGSGSPVQAPAAQKQKQGN